jgi:D-beta-D-heptose 7-phosphate kinase/D-beta-D-heptose 1-phosphate adenosyltransferase
MSATEPLVRARAESILGGFSGKRVLVVGDLMVDEHVWGQAARVSPEAPVLVVEAERQTFVPGGAANVAHQLIAFGARVMVGGVVGDDANGERLRTDLAALGADTGAVIVSGDRPTTTKTRIVAGSQQVVRVDREKRAPLPDEASARLILRACEALSACDALLFSDYDKGVLSRQTVRALIGMARESGAVVTANPKPASAHFYADADVAQFNRSEADLALGGVHRLDKHAPDATFHQAGSRLREEMQVRHLLVTRGAQGMTLFLADDGHVDVTPHRVDVFDVTGAGDSTIAGLTLALAAGAGPREAAAIGNAAGGAVVRKVGVATATREEVSALFT